MRVASNSSDRRRKTDRNDRRPLRLFHSRSETRIPRVSDRLSIMCSVEGLDVRKGTGGGGRSKWTKV